MYRLILLFLLMCFNAYAQNSLYYFKSIENGLVGVKNQNGKIIVEPNYPDGNDYYTFNKPIEEQTIEFYYLPNWEKTDFSKINAPFGAVYNRKGEFLYTPLFYDNGPDYWNNDLRRYVENNKVGLVNQNGVKITDAKWDMMWWSRVEGQAQVFEGDLKSFYENGNEHLTIIGEAKTYLIDLKGIRLSPDSLIKFESTNSQLIIPRE